VPEDRGEAQQPQEGDSKMSDAMFWALAIIGASYFAFLSICVLAMAWASKKETK